ncbi:folate-binding protein YgfZ [Phycisphaerales bacterium AB-hyl4]|uniref:Folate-binding protein YgfZ n=1 Tax=Natronomicrosphaera hydrolytica TaxID=3242702 RepID=A0ABV4U5X1_9BACT
MTQHPTIHQQQERAGAETMNYGPPPDHGGIEIVESFGQFPLEYAAIRQRVGIMHLPQRGILRFTGDDRQDFLHRMLTQDINGMTGGATRRAFQLNNKGRIVADVVVHHGDACTWLELDRLDIVALKELLEAKLFAEDVTIETFSDERVAMAVMGPAAVALVESLREDGTEAGQIEPGTHHVLKFGDALTTVYRWDDVGAPAFRLFVPSDAADAVYAKLLDAAGYDAERDVEPDEAYARERREGLRGRPVGWSAYNTTRIEAGSPLFHIDFGADSLPAETGLLKETVSFNKGCYLGQEIVARMHNLGHPRRVLVGLKVIGEALPVAGAPVYEPTAKGEGMAKSNIVGGVTSSTLSPLLGNVPIAFAVIKWGNHTPGTKLAVVAEGELVDAEVQALRFVAGDDAGGQ